MPWNGVRSLSMNKEEGTGMRNEKTSKPSSPFLHIHESELHPPETIPQTGVEHLVQQIKETADKLIRDQTNRGDVKLLSTALKELRYAFKVFAPYRRRRKVAIFGSARIKPDHPAYQQAVEFGKRMADAGYMVITGASSGIMEAGHVGAGRENSIGLNIMLPFEQEANTVIAGDNKLMQMKYFFTRKLMFVKEADSIALFPGGFGTLDEGFEVLTLVQTGKSHMFPIVMVETPGVSYWKPWKELIEKTLLANKMISPADLGLFKITESLDEAVGEILGFYRVYHSMRYVCGDLVMRLQHSLSEPFLERIRTEFADILQRGTFEQCAALPAEAADAHLVDLPRLKFRFDRYNLGRLRQLIDTINRDG
jgi:uncharacterized protein (TIGR00730 family)